MLAHFAEHERAVGAAQRAHPETVEHALVGKTPVAPGQEACEIGLEITGAETALGEVGIAPQQDASIPDSRLVTLLNRKMRVDIGAPRFGEAPRPWLHTQIKLRDAMNDGSVMQICLPIYFAFIPVVLLACSTYLLVQVLLTSIFAFATSGELSLNTASTASAPLGSILPVSEYIGIVFFSAAR